MQFAYFIQVLQAFVDKNGTNLQVIYSVSGWLKNNPQNYCVKLTSGPKLEGNACLSTPMLMVHFLTLWLPL